MPLRLRNMKDTTKKNITNESDNDELDDKPDDTLTAYTPQQRKTIIKGLRILARVAIRSYMREHGARGQAETDTDEEGG